MDIYVLIFNVYLLRTKITSFWRYGCFFSLSSSSPSLKPGSDYTNSALFCYEFFRIRHKHGCWGWQMSHVVWLSGRTVICNTLMKSLYRLIKSRTAVIPGESRASKAEIKPFNNHHDVKTYITTCKLLHADHKVLCDIIKKKLMHEGQTVSALTFNLMSWTSSSETNMILM